MSYYFVNLLTFVLIHLITIFEDYNLSVYFSFTTCETDNNKMSIDG